MLFKLLLLFLAFVSAHGLENSSIRRVRSPEPSGWQGSNGYGASSVGLARSGGGWGNGALGRSGGWGGSGNSGTRGYSSNGINGNSGCASSNGWGDSSDGFRSNRGSHTY
ncbi:keratin, type I cytoskeletal 10-like [Bicyclus anynana]|uniref:Keratin, type I cytoskeletal 10-like n=1 Tax=Bicyclus anynana TaxID=110368 RepID=A0A6J1MLU3_BICAN|nr:keratin, type I cytoskeletal 10-like [Bicyclus anynana]